MCLFLSLTTWFLDNLVVMLCRRGRAQRGAEPCGQPWGVGQPGRDDEHGCVRGGGSCSRLCLVIMTCGVAAHASLYSSTTVRYLGYPRGHPPTEV